MSDGDKRLAVGDRLFYLPTDRRERAVGVASLTISKVGRKYYTGKREWAEVQVPIERGVADPPFARYVRAEYGLGTTYYLREEDAQDALWMGQNANDIRLAVERCRDPNLLKAIKALLDGAKGAP